MSVKEKSIITRKVLVANVDAIEAYLSKDNGKFRFCQEDNKYYTEGAQKGVPLHLVRGYMSRLLVVYVDRHNFEVTINTVPLTRGAQSGVVVESNKTMIRKPELFFELLKEKQLEYEKIVEHMQNQKR